MKNVNFYNSKIVNVSFNDSKILNVIWDDSLIIILAMYNCDINEISFKISKIEDISIKKCNLNNVSLENSRIEELKLIDNKGSNKGSLYSSKVNNIKGDIINLQGFAVSLEQILDYLEKIGINLHE